MLGLTQAEKFILKEQTFYLLPEKAIYWEERKTLLVADLHFGKAAHFRKEGIAVPEHLTQLSFRKLDQILSFIDLETVIFLGDLFHSDWNQEWIEFQKCLNKYQHNFILVIGNHDVLNADQYLEAGIVLKEEPYHLGPFALSHHPQEEQTEIGESYNLCGHLHPGIKLKGKAKQSITLPCFYFGSEMGVLPAFSNFSGKHLIKIKASDHVFGITKEKVIKFK